MPGHGHPDEVNTSAREPRSAFRCMAHLTLDFLRLVLVCHCHAPRASRLGGWSPVSTLCVTPLPRPAEWVAVRPLERRLFSLSGSPISCIEGHRYAGLAFVQGSIAREPVPGDSPSSPRAALLRSIRITRARLVRRSSFAVFESPVTRDKTMCSGRPIKMIIPARLPSPVSCRCFSESSRLRSFTGIIHPPSGTWNRIVAGRCAAGRACSWGRS